MTTDAKKIRPHPMRHRRPRPVSDHFHRIYDPDELQLAINQLTGARGVDDFVGPSEEASVETSDDRNRLQCLRRIAADPRGPSRRSIMGSIPMVRRLNDLRQVMPHFTPVLDLVARAALASFRTQTPIYLPPCVLLGEPGIGKSFALRRIAEAIGADFALIPMNMTDAFRLRGLNTAWRGARMGRIAEVLQSSGSSPIVLLDEFDKVQAVDRTERPYDVWHSLFDAENARHFRDDFLEIELRADNIIWFASANDVSGFPASILDRILVLEIPRPDQQQLQVIVDGLYATCRQSFGGVLPSHLAVDVTQELARHNLRHIARLLQLALGFAVFDGRLDIKAQDVRRADALAAYGRACRRTVGFL